jgi:amino acid transporter
VFFENCLAIPLIVFLYLIWKVWSWFMVPAHRPLFVRTRDIDLYTGMREGQLTYISGPGVDEAERRKSIAEIREERKKKWYDYPKNFVTALF